jgi:hypothetical protein
MERKQFMRMVQKYRDANGGRFPKEPLRKRLFRYITCGENQYSPQNIAFLAGMKARKVKPPGPRVGCWHTVWWRRCGPCTEARWCDSGASV